jgi:type IV pilus assembly protein PilF
MNVRNLRFVYGTLVVAALALLTCGCATSQREKKQQDAATYNTQLGIAYMNRGDLGLAKQKLERAMQENPGSASVHSAMAMLQDRLGNTERADQEFKTALRLEPNSPEVQNNYAVYLCRTGRTDAGVKVFEEAAHNALYKTPEVAYTNAGVCLRAAHQDTQAAMSFQRALQLKPNSAEAAFQLADLDFARGELLEARSEIDAYLGSFDATADLLLLATRVAEKQGDRIARERYARKLRLDFPNTEQARSLGEPAHNPG